MTETIFGAEVDALIELALAEDIGSGDCTSEATIPEGLQATARLLARQDLLFCSHAFLVHFCARFANGLQYQELLSHANSSEEYHEGEYIARLSGPLRQLLSYERSMLNFVQRLSGIAGRARAVQRRLDAAGIQVLDTRKTTPGWRSLEKYAVRFGGASNHRRGLFDAFLIKNNHIDALGGRIEDVVAACRAYDPERLLEVEVRNFDELKSALNATPDWILLDNMDRDAIVEAVRFAKAQAHAPKLEASGGYTPQTVESLIGTGVDAVSLGWLTHSAPAADISLRFESQLR